MTARTVDSETLDDVRRYNQLLYAIVDPGMLDKRTPDEAQAQTLKHVEWLKKCAELLDEVERSDGGDDDLQVRISMHFGRLSPNEFAKRPDCKRCGAYMAWGTPEAPLCPFCDGGAGD